MGLPGVQSRKPRPTDCRPEIKFLHPIHRQVKGNKMPWGVLLCSMNLAKAELELDKQNHVLLLHLEIEAGTTFLGEILHLTVIINGLVARLSEVVVV